MDDKKYFATADVEEIGSHLLKKIDAFSENLMLTGRARLLEKSYNQYYRSMETGGSSWMGGESEEFSHLSINHYRNLLQHLLVMTTSQRPAFEPKAINSDSKSAAQVILADGLLDYYMREKKVERHIKQAVETCLWAAEGWIGLTWDTSEGNEYAAEDGEILKDGDIVIKNFSPPNVIYDHNLVDIQDSDWFITIEYKNKYEVAAKYKKKKDDILNSGDPDFRYKSNDRNLYNKEGDSELIAVMTFYHRPTLAVPGGRLVEFINADVILIDSELPYKKIPLTRVVPYEQNGSPFGYSTAFDLLPLQETFDALSSTVITNISTFGVQNIAVPAGHNLTVDEIVGGLNLLEFDPQLGPPQPLQLTSTSPETYNYMKAIESSMETISGVNSVSRGNPESSLKSGAALALVQSMALQFSSHLQSNYAALLEDVGTHIIDILKEYASTPRVSTIVGKSNRSLMKDWTKDDLSNIQRVIVDMGNPLSRTLAGRVNMGEQLLGAGMVKTPEQFLQVLSTGRLEPLMEGTQAELILIKNENEDLGAKKEVKAILTDNHAIHLDEHKSVLASTEARRDPELLKAVLDHMQEHIDLLRETDPVVLALLKQQPAPPVGQPLPGAPGAPGAPMGPVAAPDIEGLDTAKPVEKDKPNMPNMPSMPTNPLSGEKFNSLTGGLF